ncbi:MAG: zf-HC2 domain-containing protein [Anaerolineales bacterium]
MAKLENQLSKALYRAFCPETLELGEYQLGMLSSQQANKIQTHLAECPHCQAELAQLKSFQKEVEADLETSLADRVRIWIAERIQPGTAANSGPQLAFGLRGEVSGVHFYQAGEAQISLEVQDDPSTPGRKALVGLVLRDEAAELQAHLWQADQAVARAEVDELGNFTLHELEPGQYELFLSGPDVEIQIKDLEI